jgi:putative colanic acid biosynthesis acetyltransferase WcaF
MSTAAFARSMTRLNILLEAAFNKVVTHVPVRALRRWWLKLAGADLAPDVAIFCGAQVLNPGGLSIGRRGAIGWRTFLDARGGITMGNDVNVASDCHIITADHDVRSPHFEARYAPVLLEDFTSVGTRCMVLKGVTIGRGGVVAAGAVVNRNVPECTIVGGIPAKPIGTRPSDLLYTITPPPPLA